MIMAWRIPMLTEEIRAATIRAAEACGRDAAEPTGVVPAGQAPERLLVERLERLGYTVRLERPAA